MRTMCIVLLVLLFMGCGPHNHQNDFRVVQNDLGEYAVQELTDMAPGPHTVWYTIAQGFTSKDSAVAYMKRQIDKREWEDAGQNWREVK